MYSACVLVLRLVHVTFSACVLVVVHVMTCSCYFMHVCVQRCFGELFMLRFVHVSMREARSVTSMCSAEQGVGVEEYIYV